MTGVTIGGSNASEARAAGCYVIIKQVSRSQTSTGHPGHDNGPTEIVTTYQVDAHVPSGWSFLYITATTNMQYTAWNSDPRSPHSSYPTGSSTSTLYNSDTIQEIYRLTTCANPVDDESYHGDHDTWEQQVTGLTAFFTKTGGGEGWVLVTTSTDPSDGSMGSASGGGLRKIKDGETATFSLSATVADAKKYKFVKWIGNGSTYNDTPNIFPTIEYPGSQYTESNPKVIDFKAYFDYTGKVIILTTSKSQAGATTWEVTPVSEERVQTQGNTTETFMVYAVDNTPAGQAKEWRFVRWESSGEGVTIASPNSKVSVVTVTYPTGSEQTKTVNVQAVLESTEKYRVEIGVAVHAFCGGMGFVSGGGSDEKYEGEQYCAEIRATPYIGYRFLGWTSTKGNTQSAETATVCITASSDESQNTETWVAMFESTGETGQTEPPGPSELPGPSGASGESEESEEISAVNLEITIESTDGKRMGHAMGGGLHTGKVGNETHYSLTAFTYDDDKYKFVGWFTPGGSLVSTDPSYLVSYTYHSGYTPTSPEYQYLTAKFDYKDVRVRVTTEKSGGDEHWTVRPASEEKMRTGSETTAYFTLVAVDNTPEGEPKMWRFKQWECDVAGAVFNNPTGLTTMVQVNYPTDGEESPKVYPCRAVFEPNEKIPVTIAVEATPGGRVYGGVGPVYKYPGETVTSSIFAAADYGHEFCWWEKNGEIIDLESGGAVTVVADEDVPVYTFKAVFTGGETGETGASGGSEGPSGGSEPPGPSGGSETPGPSGGSEPPHPPGPSGGSETPGPSGGSEPPHPPGPSGGSETPGPSGGSETPGPSGASGESEDDRSAAQMIVSSNNEAMGTVTGNRLATGKVGDTRTFFIKAQVVSNRYKFLGWYVGETLVTTSDYYTLSVILKKGYSESNPEKFYYTAKFDYAGKAIHAVGEPSVANVGWSVLPADETRVQTGSNPSETFSLIAAEDQEIGDKRYKFVRWEADGTGVTISDSTKQVTTATVTYPGDGEENPKEVTFRAVLEEQEKVTVTFATAVEGNGSASGGTSVLVYLNDTACAWLTATAKAGSVFAYWTYRGNIVSYDAVAKMCLKATRAIASRVQTYTAVFYTPGPSGASGETGESGGSGGSGGPGPGPGPGPSGQSEASGETGESGSSGGSETPGPTGESGSGSAGPGPGPGPSGASGASGESGSSGESSDEGTVVFHAVPVTEQCGKVEPAELSVTGQVGTQASFTSVATPFADKGYDWLRWDDASGNTLTTDRTVTVYQAIQKGTIHVYVYAKFKGPVIYDSSGILYAPSGIIYLG